MYTVYLIPDGYIEGVYQYQEHKDHICVLGKSVLAITAHEQT